MNQANNNKPQTITQCIFPRYEINQQSSPHINSSSDNGFRKSSKFTIVNEYTVGPRHSNCVYHIQTGKLIKGFTGSLNKFGVLVVHLQGESSQDYTLAFFSIFLASNPHLSSALGGEFFISNTWEEVFSWPAAAAAKLLQSCLTLCDPLDSSPPGSSAHGIFQARVLEWVAIAFSVSWPTVV